ncbi:cytochrome b/b6 domain-containing protein [Tropicimonas sp. IMCC6043]|uniref:cytochrome b/b6 domain-containing protein n=1 Tax=Tropicimonas sp. IMCC6043 TaxID=2510645 RepID=UPI00101C71AC|nr:cytochrome b/b6 domain-containing protein [Tropicimonas sp. IMCC6043]RYH09788.1 cytochrome B [Tropicimonas sp. IMCC6043]
MAGPHPENGNGGAIAPPDPWDPLVRFSHWGIAAAVIANGLLTKPGGTLHVWIGWVAIGILAARLVWGLVGPAEARFSAFPPDPRAAISHVLSLFRPGGPREHPSHNPAAAMMVYALWLCLVVVIGTGLVMTDAKSPLQISQERAAVAAGDWSVLVNDDGESEGGGEDHDESGELVKEVHEVAANLMLILALVHVAGVAVESRALRRNLVHPMLLGSGKGR